MNEIDDKELIDFLLGRSTPSRSAEISRLCRDDPILATQLEVMAGMTGLPLRDSGPAVKAPPRRWNFGPRVLLRVAMAMFFLLGIGWTTWKIFGPKPLMEDGFSDGWLDVRLWMVARRGVHEENGHLRLVNRGSIATQQQFPGPLEIRFKWRWIDQTGDPLYAETLQVALRTTGKHKPKHSYEIEDGLIVQFSSMGGCVRLLHANEPEFANSGDGSVPIPAGAWHDIRITDDGENVAVYVSGPAVDEKNAREPVLTGRRRVPPAAHHVAVYNRELVGDAIHESHLDDFRLDTLDPPSSKN